MQTSVPSSNDKRSLTINLRGEHYRAERLTKTHYVALGSLVWEKGTGMPDLDQPGVKNQVAEQMLAKFGDPEFIKRLAYSLLAIFPTLENNNLVWFRPEGSKVPPWGTSLEPEEILQIITDVSNALQGVSTGKTTEDLLREQQERDKTARIQELERAIAQLKQG